MLKTTTATKHNHHHYHIWTAKRTKDKLCPATIVFFKQVRAQTRFLAVTSVNTFGTVTIYWTDLQRKTAVGTAPAADCVCGWGRSQGARCVGRDLMLWELSPAEAGACVKRSCAGRGLDCCWGFVMTSCAAHSPSLSDLPAPWMTPCMGQILRANGHELNKRLSILLNRNFLVLTPSDTRVVTKYSKNEAGQKIQNHFYYIQKLRKTTNNIICL